MEIPKNNSLINGALWCISARWGIKFIGIISSAILVRLLTPQDFGIIAKTFLILWFFEDFILINFTPALIRIKDPEKEHYDTAFTLNIITGGILFSLINITAFIIHHLFDNPDIAFIMHIFSIRSVFYALQSPHIVDLQKNMDFRKDFLYLVSHKLLFVIFSVLACWYYRNYYGLILSHIVGALLVCALSHYFMPYKPKLTLNKRHQFFDFSFPMMRSGLFTYISSSIDRILPAYFISNRVMGIYNFAYDFSFQLTNEVLYPLSRALFPFFSIIEDDKTELSKQYFNVLQFMFTTCSAIGLGLYLIADDLILLYAGDQWLSAIPYFKILALVGVSHVFNQIHASIFEGTGHIKLREKLILAQIIITTICMIPFVINIDLYKLTLVKLSFSLIFSFIYMCLSIKFFTVSLKKLAIFLARIFISLSVLYATYFLVTDNLFIQTCACALAFILIDLLLWAITSDPDMIEAKLLNHIKYKLSGK